jgi:hypothetical protein
VEGDDTFFVIKASGDAPGPVCFAVVSVVTGFVEDIGADQQTAGEADGQSEEVDERDEFVFGEVAEGNLQIIFEHKHGFVTLSDQLNECEY